MISKIRSCVIGFICLYIASFPLYLEAQTLSENVPKIILFSPVDNTITTKDTVLFKGRVEGAATLRLNGELVSVDDKGKFFHKYTMTTPNDYHYFILMAESPEGAQTKIARKVFYKTTELVTSSQEKEAARKPLIQLTSPQDHLITTQSKVQFSGTVYGAGELLLNGVPVDINSKGEFSVKRSLSIKDDYELFNLVATSPDKSQSTTVARRLYYKTTLTKDFHVHIQSPEDRFVSSDSEVRFQGRVVGATQLFVNGESIQFDDTGAFDFERALIVENDYNPFVFKAVDSEGEWVVSTRNVFFKQSSSLDSAVSSTILDEDQIQYKIPSIKVNSPQNNFVTYKNTVVLEGTVHHANEVFINNRVVTLSEEGQFSEVFELEEMGKYVFNIYAMGDQGLNTTELLKVFRIAETVSATPESETDQPSVITKKLMRKVSIDLAGADIRDVLNILSRKGALNIVSDKNLTGEIYVTLHEVSILDAIDFILGSQGYSYKIVDNTILVGTKTILDQPTRLETKIIRLHNLDPSTVEPLLSQYLSSGEIVQVQGHLLILTVDSRKISQLTDMISKLDAEKVPQIILEAQIIEVSKSILDNLGIDWADNYGIGLTSSLTDGTFTYSGSFSLSSVISLLESEGKARVLAKPRIKAIHGDTAEIFIGDRIPYSELTVAATGTIAESISYVDAGINLSILPEIDVYTQQIKIKVAPEVSYINGYQASTDVPIVRTRRVNTTVFVKNGNTVLIAGLFNSAESDKLAQFPLLGRVPFLGRLFSTNKVEADQTELVIAITPQIIDSNFEESIPLPIKSSPSSS